MRRPRYKSGALGTLGGRVTEEELVKGPEMLIRELRAEQTALGSRNQVKPRRGSGQLCQILLYSLIREC